MPQPIVERIGKASKDTWPEVTAALAASTRSMAELAGIAETVIPQVEEYVARGNNGTLRRRKVCEETIWVLARLGWLRTGGERNVILAAKSYADTAKDPNASDDEYQQQADELIAVIDGLPDYLTEVSA